MAIVAAMARELLPLVKGWKLESRAGGVTVYSSANAIAAFAGMGGRRAALAVNAALSLGAVHRIVSAGLAGGLHPGMRAGAIPPIAQVIDAATGELLLVDADFPEPKTQPKTGPVRPGGVILVTAGTIASAEAKSSLRARYSADLVDMEAMIVGRAARSRDIPFSAIKAVSDEYDFNLPELELFATVEGQFREAAFARYVAIRPRLWNPVLRLRHNATLAVTNLCAGLERCLEQDEQHRQA